MKDTLINFKNSIGKFFRLVGLNFLKFFQKYYLIIAMVLVTLVALVVRYKFIMYPTNDIVGYILAGWMQEIKDGGFASFYKANSDYSPIYLFMLAILLLFPDGKLITVNSNGWNYTFYENRMVSLKTVYFLFTIALAFAVYLTVKELTKSKNKALIGYVITMALPTVFVNSTIWGNCDVIYATFLVYSIYFAIKGKSSLTYVFLGLAFANKMQAIFVVPFILYFILKRKIKFWPIIFTFLTYFATMIPCYICGASFLEPFTYLGKQLGGQTDLTYGCANIWKFLELNGTELVRENATWIGILLVGVMFVIVYLRNVDHKDGDSSFKVMFLLTITTIFCLPRLHERYFYLIDVLTVIYALKDKKRWYLPIIMQISSAIAYYHYLTGKYFIAPWGEDSVTIAATINLIILAISFYDVMKLDQKDGFNQDIEELDNEIKKLKSNEQGEN